MVTLPGSTPRETPRSPGIRIPQQRSAPSAAGPGRLARFLVAGSIVTRPRSVLVDAGLVGSVVVVVLVAVLAVTGEPVQSPLSFGFVLLGALALGCGWWRHRTGEIGPVNGPADAMLIDLRDQSLLRSRVPALAGGWTVDADLRSAHGASFSGDFVVTSASRAGRLGIVLVDVSGSGPEAGARALLLAGAFEALLDAMPSGEFMPAANRHVLRHGDDEGFATAVQVSLDLVTGAYALTGAGHPPAVQYRAAGSRGGWEVLHDPGQGPALGLLAEPPYLSMTGRLAPGDSLLLYTDGLVESRRLDVERGIARLIGRADGVLAGPFRLGRAGAAERITRAIRAEDGDDRALVVIRREPLSP